MYGFISPFIFYFGFFSLRGFLLPERRSANFRIVSPYGYKCRFIMSVGTKRRRPLGTPPLSQTRSPCFIGAEHDIYCSQFPRQDVPDKAGRLGNIFRPEVRGMRVISYRNIVDFSFFFLGCRVSFHVTNRWVYKVGPLGIRLSFFSPPEKNGRCFKSGK